ncbi:hypothetical protein GCM10011381_30550 [Klenkia taihuensis]|nr:hypothetical protein GCM10011381_30550 [Klenkia taihuensis]
MHPGAPALAARLDAVVAELRPGDPLPGAGVVGEGGPHLLGGGCDDVLCGGDDLTHAAQSARAVHAPSRARVIPR